jgi:perosamine synthetase
MIPIYKPYLSKYTSSAINAIQSEWISNHGKFIDLASNKLKEIIGVKYCILMNNGTSATHCLFKALKYKYPTIQKIYVPNHVFVAPWNCCLMEYPKEYMEVMKLDTHTLNIDTSEEYIQTLEKNSAVCIVHNLGNIINVPRLKRIRPDLIFIEDNCEGLFGKYEGQYAGTESLCSAASFYGNKTITTGEGGAFFTNDLDIYEYIKNVHSHGMTEQRYIHCNIATNFRMTNIQAAFLYDQLCDIEHIILRKKELFLEYNDLLKDEFASGDIINITTEPNTEHSCWMYAIILPTKPFERVEQFMKDNGIEIRPFFYDIHRHRHLLDIHHPFDSSLSQHATNYCILLPSYPELTKEEQKFICHQLQYFLHNNYKMSSKERQRIRWYHLRQPSMSTLTCYICKMTNDIKDYKIFKSNDIFQAGELIRYQCPICQTIFGDLRFLRLSRDEISKDYEDLYSYYSEGDTTSYILEVLRDQPIFTNKSLTYLDYACGKWNKVIPFLQKEGYDIVGYDKFVAGNEYTTSTLPNIQFDVVYNCNYIEHIIDPYEDLKEIVALTKKGGHIIFITACFEYCIEFTHYHTFFFNDTSLEYISKELGITLISSKKYHFADGQFTIAKVFMKT